MNTWKKNKLFAALMLAFLALTSFSSFAQEKDLRTESDGFQWYKLRQNGKVGAQSLGGTTFIPLSRGYTFISYYDTSGGWFLVEKNGQEGTCDITGREIVAPGRYDAVAYRREDDDGHEYCVVKLNDKWGICDMNGREIIAPRYEYVSYFKGYFDVTFNGTHGIYDKTGVEVVAPKYSSVLYVFTQGYFHVCLDDKYGACDKNGREIVAPKYKSLSYKDGVFKYRNSPNEKWVSTGISLPKDNGTTTTATNTVTPTPTPTQQPQPQPEPIRQPQPFQVWQPCGVCKGSGQCQTCLGTGHSLYGTDRCWNCGGTGKCTHCAGHGGQNVIEYH